MGQAKVRKAEIDRLKETPKKPRMGKPELRREMIKEMATVLTTAVGRVTGKQ